MISIQTDNIQQQLESAEKSTASFFDSFKGLSFDDALTKMANGLVEFSFKLLIAIFVFYLGKLIIGRLYRTVYSLMVNKRVDASLTTFVLSLIRMTLYFILIITIIGILGIETSSFLALFASAGVAIGMALSGTLQNFAGGVLILLLKPYRVGDFIEAQGYAGTVKAIQIFYTVINTADNKSIIIPNGGLSTSSVNNYSLESYRRVDWTVSLAYGTDLQKALDALLDIVKSDHRVVSQYLDDDRLMRKLENADTDEKEGECDDNADVCSSEKGEKKGTWWHRLTMRRKRHHEVIQAKLREQSNLNAGIPVKADCSPFVGLNEMADSSINFVVRAWTPKQYYWPLYFDMNKRFYIELQERGFEFPYPQMDVHLSGEVTPRIQSTDSH